MRQSAVKDGKVVDGLLYATVRPFKVSDGSTPDVG
jgi:hypothetical protein